MNNSKRIGVVGIVIEDRKEVAEKLNQILSESGEIILGRMGIPSREYDLSMLSLIVEGTPDQVAGMTGKIGNLPGVSIKSTLTSVEVGDNNE
ncbi:MAG: TM1266 family iron-only hydrogenase system putative regulator [Halanaerobiaceae bacterium]